MTRMLRGAGQAVSVQDRRPAPKVRHVLPNGGANEDGDRQGGVSGEVERQRVGRRCHMDLERGTRSVQQDVQSEGDPAVQSRLCGWPPIRKRAGVINLRSVCLLIRDGRQDICG